MLEHVEQDHVLKTVVGKRQLFGEVMDTAIHPALARKRGGFFRKIYPVHVAPFFAISARSIPSPQPRSSTLPPGIARAMMVFA